MDDLTRLITQATAARGADGDKQQAFDRIVRRFQDLAFACAYGVLGDFGQAEDAAQEAFLTAWRHLDQLRTPEAFPGWLRRIVLTHCRRQTRGGRLDTVPLERCAIWRPRTATRTRRSPGARRGTRCRRPFWACPNTSGWSRPSFTSTTTRSPTSPPSWRCRSRRSRSGSTRPGSGCGKGCSTWYKTHSEQRRPSNDDGFANTVALYNEALESFLGKVKTDRNIIAVLLFGSLSHDQVWRKSDIDIVLISRTDKQPERDFCLVENGVNIHAALMPRNKFKSAVQGALQNSFFHSSFAKSTLLYTTDETIREHYANLDTLGTRDRDMQLLEAASRRPVHAGEGREVALRQARCRVQLPLDHVLRRQPRQDRNAPARQADGPRSGQRGPAAQPGLLRVRLHRSDPRPKDAGAIQAALDCINGYLDQRLAALFGPVLDYLADAGGVRTTSEMDGYFKKQAQTGSLCGVYEWLADKGVLQKVPSPLRLTDKSSVAVVDEAAYYYDGASVRKA